MKNNFILGSILFILLPENKINLVLIRFLILSVYYFCLRRILKLVIKSKFVDIAYYLGVHSMLFLFIKRKFATFNKF